MKVYSRYFIARKLQEIINLSGASVSLSARGIIIGHCVRTSYGSVADLICDLRSQVIFYENNF